VDPSLDPEEPGEIQAVIRKVADDLESILLLPFVRVSGDLP